MPQAKWTGFEQSCVGREPGPSELAKYRGAKHIWRSTDPTSQGRFARLAGNSTLGNFHTFAAGISYISILTGTFQLFYFGYGSGGRAYWWSWPMVFASQFMVALCFAGLAARYPVAGSVYNWSKKIGNPHLGWLAGWMMLFASVASISAVALSYQLTLPRSRRSSRSWATAPALTTWRPTRSSWPRC